MKCLSLSLVLVAACLWSGCGDEVVEPGAESANNDPVNNAPVNNDPDQTPNNAPANNDPVNNDPGNNDPANNDPGNNDPGNNDPGNNAPVNNDPGNNDPGGEGFSEVFAAVFVERGCTAGYCHGAGQGGFTATDEETTWLNLVEVEAAAADCGLTQRVVPGDPEQSILWHRLRPAAMDEGEPCFEKMPPGSEGLDEETAQLVFDWILAGAM